jgi:hypothetical protein
MRHVGRRLGGGFPDAIHFADSEAMTIGMRLVAAATWTAVNTGLGCTR